MIKNIVFDMGGVLIHYDPKRIISHLRLPPEDEKLLLREVFRSLEWVQMDRGVIGQEAAAAVMKENLPERLHASVDRLLAWWELELRPMEGMAELVEELKGLGYGIYLLSNASVRQPEYFPRIPGSQFFDGKIVSGFYRLLKPQHEIFELLFREFLLKPEECFFIDDSTENVESARFLGMPGAVFDGDVAYLRQKLRAYGAAV